MQQRILTGFFERMKGLLGRDSLPEGVVFVFPHCASIHTFGMRFAIDVVFLDRNGLVLAFYPNVPPGRILFGPHRTSTTVEAQAGWIHPTLGKMLEES